MPQTEIPRSAEYAIRIYDEQGELAMLAWLVQEQGWADGTILLPDGPSVVHENPQYRFRFPGRRTEVETRPAVMKDHARPSPPEAKTAGKVHIHIGHNTEFNHGAWPELHNLRESTDLTVEVAGLVSIDQAHQLAADQDGASILGRQTEHYEGPGVMDRNTAYEQVENFAEAVNDNGLGPVEPIPDDEMDITGWDNLIRCCYSTVDMEWRFQHDVVDLDWLTSHAADVMSFLRPAVAKTA